MRATLIFLAALTSFAASTTVQYPKLISWQNEPIIEFVNNRKAIIKKDLELKNSFAVVTGMNDQAEFRFTHGEDLIIHEKTKIQVPQVSPDTGEVPEVFIFDGTVRFKSTGKVTPDSKLAVKSAFFDIKFPADLDVIITVDKYKASAQFQVIAGQMTAKFLDFDRTEQLKAGESIVFQGEKDNEGNIKYDYLLETKKMPHGELLAKKKFDITDFLEKEKIILKEKAVREEKSRKAKSALALKKDKLYNAYLCHSPVGQKNDCYWIKKDTLCFRYRCNVSGQWGDETERPLTSACLTKPISTNCDY